VWEIAIKKRNREYHRLINSNTPRRSSSGVVIANTTELFYLRGTSVGADSKGPSSGARGRGCSLSSLWAIVIMSLHSLHWNVRSSGIPAKLGSSFMIRVGSRHIGHAGLSTSMLCDVVMSKRYAPHSRSC
jgi:hypothetical protein